MFVGEQKLLELKDGGVLRLSLTAERGKSRHGVLLFIIIIPANEWETSLIMCFYSHR
jgi:hypothetical protein